MQPTRPVAFVGHGCRAESAKRPLALRPECEELARAGRRNSLQGLAGIRGVRHPARENPCGGQARLTTDKERPCGPIESCRQSIHRGSSIGRIEPKHNGQTQVGVIVPPTLMCTRISRRSTGPSGRDATGRPCPIVLAELCGLVVGHSTESYIPLPHDAEDNPILQRLMFSAHSPRPPERVGEQASEHRLGRHVPNHAVGVNHLPTEGGQRSMEPQMQPTHQTLPVRITLPDHCASSFSDGTRSVPGITASSRLINLLASPVSYTASTFSRYSCAFSAAARVAGLQGSRNASAKLRGCRSPASTSIQLAYPYGAVGPSLAPGDTVAIRRTSRAATSPAISVSRPNCRTTCRGPARRSRRTARRSARSRRYGQHPHRPPSVADRRRP